MPCILRLFVLGAVTLAAGAVAASDAIEFDGDSLALASQAAENDDSIQEFIPKGETLDA
jgi:hypothetical protein